jgi:hypothetical protein
VPNSFSCSTGQITGTLQFSPTFSGVITLTVQSKAPGGTFASTGITTTYTIGTPTASYPYTIVATILPAANAYRVAAVAANPTLGTSINTKSRSIECTGGLATMSVRAVSQSPALTGTAGAELTPIRAPVSVNLVRFVEQTCRERKRGGAARIA